MVVADPASADFAAIRDAAAAERLAPFKVPRYLEAVAELPAHADRPGGQAPAAARADRRRDRLRRRASGSGRMSDERLAAHRDRRRRRRLDHRRAGGTSPSELMGKVDASPSSRSCSCAAARRRPQETRAARRRARLARRPRADADRARRPADLHRRAGVAPGRGRGRPARRRHASSSAWSRTRPCFLDGRPRGRRARRRRRRARAGPPRTRSRAQAAPGGGSRASAIPSTRSRTRARPGSTRSRPSRACDGPHLRALRLVADAHRDSHGQGPSDQRRRRGGRRAGRPRLPGADRPRHGPPRPHRRPGRATSPRR